MVRLIFLDFLKLQRIKCVKNIMKLRVYYPEILCRERFALFFKALIKSLLL